MAQYYEDENGYLVTIDELWDEFNYLKSIEYDDFDCDFEQYVSDCIGEGGTLKEVTLWRYEYETLWSNVGKSLQRFMDMFEIRYELKKISNLIWHFDITVSKHQYDMLVAHIKQIAA